MLLNHYTITGAIEFKFEIWLFEIGFCHKLFLINRFKLFLIAGINLTKMFPIIHAP